jgi:RHS repeat-associated protein
MAAPYLTADSGRTATEGWVNFSPDGGYYYEGTLQISIDMCTVVPVDWNNLDVEGPTGSLEGYLSLSEPRESSQCDDYASNASGTIPLSVGENTIVANVDFGGGEGLGGWTMYYRFSSVQVHGDGTIASKTVYSTGVDTFTVANTSASSRTILLVATCPEGLTCSSVPASVVVGANDSVKVPITYSTGTAITYYEIALEGTDDSDSNQQSESVEGITVTSLPGPPSVGPPTPSRPVIERDLCLTMSAGTDGAYECGDLRLAHSLPEVRTFGTTRAPTLLFNSAHAAPRVLIAREFILRPSLGVRDSVVATLSVNGQPMGSRSWPGSQWALDSTPRRVLVGGETALATGTYPYMINFQTYVGGTTAPTADSVLVGEVLIVNRTGSPFGAGWWIAGLEQLRPISGGSDRLWIGGDGSARIYRAVSGTPNTWRTDFLDRPDILTFDGTRFVRHLSGGTQVWFDTAGRHIGTVNRLRHLTTFEYTGATIDSPLGQITVLPGVSYAFHFSGSPARLDSVSAPGVSGPRKTRTTITGGQLRAVMDPDSTVVDFGYAHADTHRIIWRENRLDHRSNYAYDAAGKLKEASFALNATETSLVTFQAAESRGYRAATGIDTALNPVNVMTVHDGPRPSPVSDITRFRVNAYGAPTTIKNALNDSTVIKRENTTFPALATEVVNPGGFTTRAVYDATYGHLTKSIAIEPYGSGSGPDTTRYVWNTRWDVITLMVRPEHDSVMYVVNADDGNRTQMKPGASSSRAIVYDYGPTGMLSRITHPGGAKDSIAYDGLGNVSGVRTPLGAWTRTWSDAIGRPYRVTTQIDAANTKEQVDTVVYDLAGRIVFTAKRGPAMNGAPIQRLEVETEFDLEGKTLEVVSSDSVGSGASAKFWTYDLAGRAIAETATDGGVDSTFYDRAGNVDSLVTRRGHRIRMTYNVLNQLTQRIVPQVSYPHRKDTVTLFTNTSWAGHLNYPNWPTSGDSVIIPQNTATFFYDAQGRVLWAKNRDARVYRTYHPNGLLATEVDSIRTYTDTSDFTKHAYALAYAYDGNGRRTVLTHPSNLIPSGSSGTTSYQYNDPYFGGLTKVTGLLTNDEYRFTYDLRGLVDTVIYPGNVRQRLTRDANGRITREVIRVPTNVPDPFSDSLVRRANYTYDAQDRLTFAGDSARYLDTLTMQYSGLGHLRYLKRRSWGRKITDNQPVQMENIDSTAYDALGNITRNRSITTNFFDGTDYYSLKVGGVRTHYYDSNLRVDSIGSGHFSLFEYDPAGNVRYERTSAEGFDDVDWSSRRMYYAADGTLWGSETKVLTKVSDDRSAKQVFEEYRYDALGRRILLRSRIYCVSMFNTQLDNICENRPSWIRRTVWDGAQELYEIQAPGGGGDLSVIESDSGVTEWRPGLDFTAEFGRVAYINGPAIDQPLGLTRIKFRNYQASWPAFTIVPLWNVRGQVETGYFNEGSTLLGTSGTADLAYLHWTLNPFAYATNPETKLVWHGSLVEGKVNRTGLMYRRNRYYDPGTGRFTQEDPIGLAGGLNLYGYAGGDPFNFSDPFGLCPCGLVFVGGAGALAANAVYPGLLHYAQTVVTTHAAAAAVSLINAAYEGGTVVIGKVGTYNRNLQIGERTLSLPDMGGVQENWKQNAGKLREVIRKGAAVRDSHVDPETGALLESRNTNPKTGKLQASFLTMERALLEQRGYIYNQGTRMWEPPPDDH